MREHRLLFAVTAEEFSRHLRERAAMKRAEADTYCQTINYQNEINRLRCMADVFEFCAAHTIGDVLHLDDVDLLRFEFISEIPTALVR